MFESYLKTLEKYRIEFLLGILFMFPLLPISFLGVLGVIISFFLYFFSKKKPYYSNKKHFFFSIFFFLTLVVSLIYSENYEKGVKEIIKSLLIIVFPIVIILLPALEKKVVTKLLAFFLFVNIILCIYVFNLAIEILAYKKMLFLRDANIFEKIAVFIKTPFHVPFNWSSRGFKVLLFFHKAYISLSLCLSVFIALYFILYKKSKIIIKFLLLFLIILFVYFIIYMDSLPNLLSLTIGVPTLIFYRLSFKISALIFLVGLILLIFIPKKTIRFEIYKDRIEKDYRINLWDCSLNVVKNDYVLGVGIGDQLDELFSCYETKSDIAGFSTALKTKKNSHNQYLSLLISGGLISLLSFLALIFFNIRNAILKKDVLFLVFIILILINFCFENMLSRIYGIYFFALFNSFFIKRNLLFIK